MQRCYNFHRCADPLLCFTDDTGQVYVNPSVRLAVKSTCAIGDGSDCADPMSFKWGVEDAAGEPMAAERVAPFLLGGDNTEDVSISKEFFANGSTEFALSLQATNGKGVKSTYAIQLVHYNCFSIH